MMPRVRSSVAALFDALVDPSPPPLPFAHTVTMPRRASASCCRTMVGASAPHERLTTLIGGQMEAGTPAPHGAAWFSRIHANALMIPISSVVDEIITIRAPGAEPPA